ncbi:polysaccharide biosynthesis/export family protein [Prochlorococcus sp. AH-736-P10]|nr:polysaccharide biosynthesis/export family protein [Prochlorococcus sp. AH-736-P10]MDA9683151.1 polysaccharide biosynthesis/export family protein [Prochlorococcus sp. AH-736-P10]
MIENKFIRLFSFKRYSKTFLISCFLISFFIFDLSKAESNNSNANKKNAEIAIDNLDSQIALEDLNLDSVKKINAKNINQLSVDYIKSRKDLEDYIIDTGDALFIEFENAPRGLNSLNEENQNELDPKNLSYLEPKSNLDKYILDENDQLFIKFIKTPELNSTVTLSKLGEISLPRIKEIYVRGLTINQLEELLKIRYEEFLIDPEIEITISGFKFVNSGIYNVDLEGEIFLPKIKETYVRGLTPSELSEIIQKKYSEFNINAKTTVKIATFKKLRILVGGEVRTPGIYNFPAFTAIEFKNIVEDVDKEGNLRTFFDNDQNILNEANQMIDQSKSKTNSIQEINKDLLFDYQDNSQDQIIDNTASNNENNKSNFQIKRPSDNFTTISNAIRRAGGITSKTDLSRIEILRDIPIGKGGGKKRAIVDFTSFINENDPTNDVRLFDGDRIFIPKLASASSEIIPKSILSGLSPKFITVDIFGRVENPGNVKLPLEASLSDAIDLTGPIKPLSGKIVLIRYNQDGTISKKNISYSARAKRGSNRNPFVKQGDLISVKNSILGKTTGVIKEFTAPFVGIYSTKAIIEGFSD